MTRYHHISVGFVMRDCKDNADAVKQLARLLPHSPDESTTHIESWEVEAVGMAGEEPITAGDIRGEAAIEEMIRLAERMMLKGDD